eukprot:jgi/Botrbrau1/21407/Bobra.0216s0026.1
MMLFTPTFSQDDRIPLEEREGAALTLAEEQVRAGDTASARLTLAQLELFPLSLQSRARLILALRRAELYLSLHDQVSYLDLMMPILAVLLRHRKEMLTNTAAQEFASLDSAARSGRWRRLAQDRGPSRGGEEGPAPPGLFRSKEMEEEVLEEAPEGLQVPDFELEEWVGPRDHKIISDSMLVKAVEEVLQLLILKACHEEGQALATAALTVFNDTVIDKQSKSRVRRLLAELYLEGGKPGAAFEEMRRVCAQWPSSTAVWNFYARVVAAAGSAGHGLKYLLPLRQKAPATAPLILSLAHCLAMQGSYNRAISELFQALRLEKEGEGPQPLVLLCLALAFLGCAMGRRAVDRPATLLYAFSFLEEYSQQRKNSQEAEYNMGRAAQQLGLMHLALEFYKRVLNSSPPPLEQGMVGIGKGQAPARDLDLRREAAHNMALIYRASGADQLAREILRQHLTV